MEENFKKLRQEGFRLTPQRASIMKFMRDNLSHPTAEEIFNHIRKEFPSISFSTVYNTLRTLREAGLIRELLYSPSRFDSNLEDHCHLVCIDCNKIEDFVYSDANRMKTEVSYQTRFEVESCDVGIFGLCPGCRDKERE